MIVSETIKQYDDQFQNIRNHKCQLYASEIVELIKESTDQPYMINEESVTLAINAYKLGFMKALANNK